MRVRCWDVPTSGGKSGKTQVTLAELSEVIALIGIGGILFTLSSIVLDVSRDWGNGKVQPAGDYAYRLLLVLAIYGVIILLAFFLGSIHQSRSDNTRRTIQAELQHMSRAELLSIIRAPAQDKNGELRRSLAVDAILAGGCTAEDRKALLDIALANGDRMITDRLIQPAYVTGAIEGDQKAVDQTLALLEPWVGSADVRAAKIAVGALEYLIRRSERRGGQPDKSRWRRYRQRDIIDLMVLCMGHPSMEIRHYAFCEIVVNVDANDRQEVASVIGPLRQYREAYAKRDDLRKKEKRAVLKFIDASIKKLA